MNVPPNEAATADEIAKLITMAGERNEEALQQIAYWNAGPPSYRWNQITVGAIDKRGIPGASASRILALVHAAIYDATVAAWDSKYTYNRPRPSTFDDALTTVIPDPVSPSYPSEYAVTAGAASAVLASLFPDDAEFFEVQAQAAVNSRLLAGVEYPSDVEAGLELGRQVAELAIAYGTADGSNAAWTGSVPTERQAGEVRTRSRRSQAPGKHGRSLRPTSFFQRRHPPTIGAIGCRNGGVAQL